MGVRGTYLWDGQQRIQPLMATVLVETPRGFPAEALGATGQIKPGPPPSDALWQATADAIVDSLTLV